MTSRLRWAAVLAIAIAACTGKTGPAGTSTGTISGTVGNAAGPLAGAAIEIQPGGYTLATDAVGHYAASVPVGVYTVAATAAGYVAQTSEPQSVVAGGAVDASFVLIAQTAGPVSVNAGADRFQAGFGVQVQLTATAGPAGANLTYQWAQVPGPGPRVTLVGGDTATPTFTTKTLQELEDGGFYAIRRSPGALGFSEADVARASYEFEVLVSDGVTADTDRVLIRSAVGQPGLTVVSVDTLIPLGAEDDTGGYAWTCTRLEGNAEIPCEDGVLTGATLRNPVFRAKPLQEGLYTFTTGAQSFQLRAASYIGAREVPGVVTCATGGCHDLRQAAWAETKHAKYLERALDKGEIPGYQEVCIRCHTTGYDPEANNGGFADVARRPTVAWAFPGAVADMRPELKALAAVGCENCHGPGSLHKTASRADATSVAAAKASIGKSYAAVDCAQCHATEPYENQGLQWVTSRHASFTSGFEPAASDPALRGFCASCHSSQGFVTWARSGFNNVTPVGADVTEPQTCSACHDPHGEAVDADGKPTPRQLRIYGDVQTSVPGMGAKGVGPAALCMTCHNSRTSVITATQTTDAGPPTQAAPHTPSQADVLLGKNAALLGGPVYPSSSHTGVPKLCVGCHMAPTPPLGQVGHNLVGGHTFSMGNGADLFNLAACTVCHPGLTTYDRTAYGDYDGNGVVEGVRTEVVSLVALVGAKVNERAGTLWPVEAGGPSPTVISFHGRIRILKHFDDITSDPVCNPASPIEYPESCFAFAAGAIPQTTPAEKDFLGAAWNWFLTKNERSNGIHNTAFSVSVLQRSYQALNDGVPLKDATPR